MKSSFIILLFLYFNANSQVFYSNSNGILEINLSLNVDSNYSLIRKLLSDTSSKNSKYISLSGSLSLLPENIYELYWIEGIDLNFSKPLVIKKEFSNFKNLKRIMVFSEISTIDENVILPKLELFWAISTNLNKFPLAIFNWKNIKEINLQGGNFKSIPPGIESLTSLEVLNLSNNNIEHLPIGLWKLTNLKSLCLIDNRLTIISDSVCNLTNLQEFYLNSNKDLNLTDKQIELIRKLPQIKEFIWK